MPANEALTKHIRLLIYNYLDLRTTIQRLCSLSSAERERIKTSEIAREGKVFELKITEESRPKCLIHDNRM